MRPSERDRESRDLTVELLKQGALGPDRLEAERREFLASPERDFGRFLEERGVIAPSDRRAACGPEAGRTVGGRYELERQIGRGGWGRIYRARDRETGEAVAVKLLLIEGIDAHGGVALARQRFQREAEVGISIRHENVVRTLAVGPFEDSLYIAMELVDGRTLEELIADGPLPPLDAARIAMEALRGLAAMHAAGVVHRDVKARNIMVDVTGVTKLMDFGLAVRADLARLTRVGTVVGTPHYMAPEQILSQEIDARTDTYAVGVTLYQLLCGRLPFEEREGMAVLYAILQEQPEPIQERVPDLHPALAAAVKKAMRREKGRRFQSALAFADALATAVSGRADADTLRIPAPDPTLAGPAPHGRDAEVATLLDALRAVGRGERMALLLSGEAGAGKTHLCEDAARRAAYLGLAVLRGRCATHGGGYSYHPIVEALRSSLLERGIGTEQEIGRFVEEQAPELRPALPVLRLVLMMGSAQAAAFGREHVFAAVAGLLEALSRRGALLVVEDVQGLDDGTIGLLEHLLFTETEHGLCILLTGRPEETPRGGPWDALRTHLAGRDVLRAIPLPPLPADAVAAMVRELLGEVDPGLLGRIQRQSEGNPLHVLELAKLLASGGLASVDEPHARLPMPQKIRDLVRRRLAPVPADARDVLDVAAVAGDPFDADPIGDALGTTRLQVLRTLQKTEREHHLVHALPSGSYRFDHAKVREVLYGELAPELRAEYHRLLAAAMEEAMGSGAEGAADVPRLADHLLAAGERARAAPYLKRAADLMREKQDLAGARLRYETLLPILPAGDPARAAAIEALADTYAALGEHAKASAMLRAALQEVSGKSVLRLELMQQLGVSLYYEGDLPEAARVLEEVRASAEAVGEMPILLAAVGNIGNVHYVRGEWAEALACYRKLLGEGVHSHTTTVLNNVGNTLARLGRAREAVAHFDRALQAARTLGTRDHEAVTLRNLGACLYERRHFRRAIIFLERAEKLAEEIGFAFLLSWLWPYLGAAHVRAGAGRDALRIVDRGIALAARQASREHHAEALCCKGDALLHLNERDAARAAYEEAGRIAASAGIAPLHAWASRGTAAAQTA